MRNKRQNIIFAIFLFSLTFGVYFLSNPHPRDWYNHYIHLSYSFLQGMVDTPTLPAYYQDKIAVNSRIYLPFPPVPALLLLPAVTFWGLATSQPLAAAIIGAANTSLVFLLLRKLGKDIRTSLFISIFFAFGTVHWYAAVIGTTWFFAHIVGVFFTLLSLHAYKNNRPFLSGLFLALAFLSRLPIFLGLVFFFKKDRKWLVFFGSGLFIGLIGLVYYNWLRFGNIFTTGYEQIYQEYIQGYFYSFYRSLVPYNFPHFHLFDIRNIPLHLFTIFLFPPEINLSFPYLKPSPYGLSIILTSPFLFYALKAPFKNLFVSQAWMAVLLIAFVDFLHYSQGWVQFGYRFALDFLPFLLLPLAFAFQKINKKHLLFIAISILVNYWGVWWGIKLGW